MWGNVFISLFPDLYPADSDTSFLDWEPGKFSRRNSTTAIGRKLIQVECEACQYRYAYLVKRVVSCGARWAGSKGGKALDEAARSAKARASKHLKGSRHVVPCPECGHVQNEMIPQARREYLRGLFFFGVALCFLSLIAVLFLGILFLIIYRSWEPSPLWVYFVGSFGVIGFIGLALVLARFVLALSFNPNNTSRFWRLDQGQRRALKPKHLAKALEIFKDIEVVFESHDD